MMGKLDSPDATSDDYRRVATYMDPEQAKVMKDFYDSMADEERETALSEYGQVLSAFEGGRPDVGIELLKMQAKAAPDEKSRAYGNMLVQMAESGDLGIDAIKKTINTHLSFMPGGDKVLDSVQQAQKAPLDINKLIADTELTEAQKKETLARTAKLEIETQNLLKEEGGVVPPEKVAAAEDGLRKELYSNTKDFQTIAYNYDVIKSAETTGIGDAALVFGIMKMYDPGSTVREGEQATAANSGGIPAFYTGLYNKLIGGGTMSETVRKQIKSQAGKIYDTAKEGADVKTKLIEDIAKRRGLNLLNIRTPPEGEPTPSKVSEKPTVKVDF
jgi:hypothetical protein